MKLSNIALSLLVAAALGLAIPQVNAAQGKSAGHRQDASHGHKGSKGGKSASHRQDGSHRKGANKGGKSADHRQDGGHRNDHAGDNGR